MRPDFVYTPRHTNFTTRTRTSHVSISFLSHPENKPIPANFDNAHFVTFANYAQQHFASGDKKAVISASVTLTTTIN